MPKKDGITATAEIRALEHSGRLQRKHIIVALTAVVNTESRGSEGCVGCAFGLLRESVFKQ
jgi:CheY-like chemotaxis protein